MMLNKQQTLLSQRKAAATVPCGRALFSKQISPCVLSQQQRRSTAVIVASLTRKPEDMLANGASTAPHCESAMLKCQHMLGGEPLNRAAIYCCQLSACMGVSLS